jgi:hypothetical protein
VAAAAAHLRKQHERPVPRGRADDFIADDPLCHDKARMCEVDERRRGHVFQLLTKRADRMLSASW